MGRIHEAQEAAYRWAKRVTFGALATSTALVAMADKGQVSHLVPPSEASREGNTLQLSSTQVSKIRRPSEMLNNLLGLVADNILRTPDARAEGVCGPASTYRTDAVELHQFPALVRRPILGNVDDGAPYLGAFVDKSGNAFPEFREIPLGEVQRDEEGALLLPNNRFVTLRGTDGPEGRTPSIFFRVPQWSIIYGSFGELISAKVFASTCGDLEAKFPQLDRIDRAPSEVTNPHDNHLIIAARSDASRGYFRGPVVAFTGAVSGHAIVGMMHAPSGYVSESQMNGFLQISRGNHEVDETYLVLDDGSYGHFRANVGPWPGPGQRRSLPTNIRQVIGTNVRVE